MPTSKKTDVAKVSWVSACRFRLLDLMILLVVLPVLAPVFLLTCIAGLIVLGRPLFFSQPRGGQFGVPFQIHKFRTMSDARDSEGKLMSDEYRTSRFGAFLRSSSLDELPAIWNVLKGEMSLVGPRPFIADYLPLYTPEQARRHLIRPGITGWAQVNGRNGLTWEEKFELDIWLSLIHISEPTRPY